MELLITIAYIILIRLVFFEFHLLRYNLAWKIITVTLWLLAVMTEVLFLGQYAPYTKEMFVQSYVVQMAPNLGGEVEEVFITTNQPVKKGDPLFSLDPTVEQARVQLLEASLAAANTGVAELVQDVARAEAELDRIEADLKNSQAEYDMVAEAAQENAASQFRMDSMLQKVQSLVAQREASQAGLRRAQLALDSEIDGTHTAVAEVAAELAEARYFLENTTVYAPSDGYAINMQLHPGAFIRLKQPVMSFVSTEEMWMVGRVLQQGAQFIKAGDEAEVALRMYPGRVFKARVKSVTYGSGDAQGVPSGRIPRIAEVVPTGVFIVRLELTEPDAEHPLCFGASGLAAIYAEDAADILKVVRKLELRAESFLFYVFNPF